MPIQSHTGTVLYRARLRPYKTRHRIAYTLQNLATHCLYCTTSNAAVRRRYFALLHSAATKRDFTVPPLHQTPLSRYLASRHHVLPLLSSTKQSQTCTEHYTTPLHQHSAKHCVTNTRRHYATHYRNATIRYRTLRCQSFAELYITVTMRGSTPLCRSSTLLNCTLP